jgi:hypothetical protein
MFAQENKIRIAVMRLFVRKVSAVATLIERLLCVGATVNSLSFEISMIATD